MEKESINTPKMLTQAGAGPFYTQLSY